MTSKASKFHQTFQHLKSTPIPELQCVLVELVHIPTGAQVMHISNQDSENLFCLSFQTIPTRSDGVAHILEHTVLCGSKKYPIKDPFFAMNRRSLNTFMNALTGADFTCYPAATQVPKDFYNLLDVYLDAVFYPNLNKLSFLQEGCRLEFANTFDPSSPLEYKGVVYNEMKGSLSSPSARLAEAINACLFPDLTYGVNSGGDPKVIPELTYEGLKQFHQTFYHPSRCLFFFYGNMPLEGHLNFICEKVLNHTEKASSLPMIPPQPRFSTPRDMEFKYPITLDENTSEKTMVAFAWLTCHILEQQETLALNVLETILLDTDASPLKRAFLNSGLCKQVQSFMDTDISEIPIGIILKGCHPSRVDDLENILTTTLKEIVSQGISLELIENAIHQLEFYRSEITGDHAPFGLSLFMRSGLLKQHGANPEEGLMVHALFDRLRQLTLTDPRYFENLIQKYFLDNPHHIRIVMKPDPKLPMEELQEEKERLEKIKASLSPQEISTLISTAHELTNFQQLQQEENVDILPKVSLKDVPRLCKDYPLTREKMGQVEIFHHNTFTNDIIYADLTFDLPNIDEEDLPYLRLLTIILTQIGSNGRNYLENLHYIQGNTGGIGAGISFNMQAHDFNLFSPTFHIRGKALHRKASKLFPLIYDIVTDAQLDDFQRIKEIIFKHYTNLEDRLNQSALKYAINLSSSPLNAASKMANALYGLNYFWKIRSLVRNFDQEGPYAIAKIQELQEKVLSPENPHLILSCDNATYDELKGNNFYNLIDLPTSPTTKWSEQYPLVPIDSQGRIIASPVAFIGKVFKTVSYTHPDSPALNIASFLFDNLLLHTLIREQGGAYGGGSVSNALSGNFYFYSYRDPHIYSTLQAFKEAVNVVLKGLFDEKDLEEAKLEMIQTLDTPISPGSRAEVAYGWCKEGRTVEIRQNFRDKLLALTKEELIEVVKTRIKDQMDQGATIVFAGQNLLEKTNVLLATKKEPLLKIEKI